MMTAGKKSTRPSNPDAIPDLNTVKMNKYALE